MKRIKITSKGQITIPRDMRDKLEIGDGMYLSGYIKDGSIVLRPLPQDDNKAKLLSYAYQKSRDSVGLEKVREMTRGFNLDMTKQVREIREEEADSNE